MKKFFNLFVVVLLSFMLLNFFKTTLVDALTEEVLNVENGSEYYEPVTPIFTEGSATLNGVSFTSETEISDIGNYELIVNWDSGNTTLIEFTISPFVEENYYESFAFTIDNAISISLNGNVYNNEMITYLGINTLEVTGVEGYRKSFNFSLHSIMGVVDGLTYQSEVLPVIDPTVPATYDLDGNPYIINTEVINIVGEHTLTVTGANGYIETYTFTISETTNIQDYDEFIGSVVINVNALFKVDDVDYMSGVEISTVGYHELTIIGVNNYNKIIHFTIHPMIEEIENGAEYNTSVLVAIEHAQLVLNGKNIDNNTIITSVGYNTLKILGENDYEKTISFTIFPSISNIEEGRTYTDSLIINIPNTNLVIDGEEYITSTVYNKIGSHVLTIIGEGGYTRAINFAIEISEYKLIQDKIYEGSTIFDIPGATLKIDDKNYSNNTIYNKVGYHTLTIIGTGDYLKTVDFLVLENNQDIFEGAEYNDSVTPNIPGATLKLNDVLIENNSPIAKLGYHILTIIGTNGYRNTINFSIIIHPDVENKEYTKPLKIKKLDGIMLLNGVEITKDTIINRNGKYTLEIIGVDYKKTINFEYNNHFIEKGMIIAASGAMLIIVSLVLIKTRKNVV